MEYTNIETPLTATTGAKLFAGQDLKKGEQLVQEGRINVSFNRGSPERYFIISGLVLTNPKHETRLSVKVRDDRVVLSGQCDCSEWSAHGHCSHVAALYLKFFHDREVVQQMGQNPKDPKVLAIRGGCHVEQYGTILSSPNELINSPFNSTYAGLQFVLRNGKVEHFPMVQDFKESLIVHFHHPQEEKPQYHSLPNWQSLWQASFSYQDQQGEQHKYISLFEYHYLFNWQTGEAFHLPSEVKNFIKKIRNNYGLLGGDDILKSTQKLRQDGILALSFNDHPLDLDLAQAPHIRLRIEQAGRKSFFALSLELHNDQQDLLDIPECLQSFAYTNGLLDAFRTKNEALRFVLSYFEMLESLPGLHRHHIHASGRKKKLKDWTDQLRENDETFFMNDRAQCYCLSSNKVLSIFRYMISFFGESVIKGSTHNHEQRRLVYLIAKNQFFLGISSFYQKMQTLNIPVYFQEKKIRRWSSNVRFERSKSELDWFDLQLHANSDDLAMIRNADLDSGFMLSDEGLVLLDNKDKELLRFLKKYTQHEAKEHHILDDDQKVHSFSLNFKRARIFELFELKKLGIDGALTDEEIALCENLANLEEIPSYPIPGNFVSVARPYQITGHHWLLFLYQNRLGACLADDMGLGKTLQTIMFLQSILEEINKVLIVCPVSILMNWKYEIERFSNFKAHVYYGGERDFNIESKVIITSYGVMRKEVEQTFKDEVFDVLILDEVQHLKNVRSQGATAARNLKANFRICLTGTPVENDLSEFYNILDLSLPGLWGETSFLKSRSPSKGRLIAKRTAKPFILRRSKTEVLSDLPDKEEHYVYLHFEQEEQDFYQKHLQHIQSRLSNPNRQKRYGEILKSLLELRQRCLWQDHTQNGIQSTKIDFLMENLQQILEENHKVLVFSQFTTYLNIIEGHIKNQHWKYSRIDGSQTMKTRMKHIEDFQNGDSQIFLISLKAGGVGLNLTAASYIFLMDPWWNPAVENQAIDRAHRIGQENKVTVYRPIIKNSVEEKVITLQESKRELFHDLMASDDKEFYSGKLSMDDFKELLELD